MKIDRLISIVVYLLNHICHPEDTAVSVRFSYTNSHDEVKDIQTEPVCLQYKWYNWYLIGYYEKYQDYCMFKLVRMENLQATQIKL